MAQRGRKSAAELAVITHDSPDGTQRLAPLRSLSDAEKAIWVQMVNDHPADSFSDRHVPLIELYCRHVIRGRVLADQIDTFDPEWLLEDSGLSRYNRLLSMAERESRAASSLATRLRLTRQSIDQQTIARAQMKSKSQPWKE